MKNVVWNFSTGSFINFTCLLNIVRIYKNKEVHLHCISIYVYNVRLQTNFLPILYHIYQEDSFLNQ